MMTTVLGRSISSVQTVQAQDTPTVILQIGDSLARLTAHQARQLASVLVIQAEAIAKTESTDSLLVVGWIAKPCSFRGGAQEGAGCLPDIESHAPSS